MNNIRVDINNVKSAPCGMISILYIGNSMSQARRAFNNAKIGYNAWGESNSSYGVVLSKWSEKERDYVVIDSKGL